MAERITSPLEIVLFVAMMAGGVVSFLSLWSDEWFDIRGSSVRMVSGVVIVVLAFAYFRERKKNG